MTSTKRVGLPLLRDAESSPLSPHFGKAKWLGIYDAATGELRFLRNAGLNGSFVSDLFANERCTDVVLANIGEGALGHLTARGVRVFRGAPEVSAKRLLTEIESGALEPVESAPARDDHEPAEGADRCGCHCAEGHGSDRS